MISKILRLFIKVITKFYILKNPATLMIDEKVIGRHIKNLEDYFPSETNDVYLIGVRKLATKEDYELDRARIKLKPIPGSTFTEKAKHYFSASYWRNFYTFVKIKLNR